MLEKTEQAYYLTKTEFLLLAGLQGMTEVYGFMISETENLTQNDIYAALNSLVGRGLVKNMESHFILSEETEEMFTVISTMKTMYLLYSNAQLFPMQCIYIGAKTVIAQMDGGQSRYVRLELVPNEELGDYLVQGGFLPQQSEMAYVKKGAQEIVIPEHAESSIVIECHSIEQRTAIHTISVIEQPLYDFILMRGDEVDDVYYYTKEKICELLFMKQEGRNDDFS